MDPTILLWIGGVLVVVAVVLGIIFSVSSQRSAEEKRLDAFVEAGIEIPDNDVRSAALSDWLSKKSRKNNLVR